MQFNVDKIYNEKKEEIIENIKNYVSILSDYDENTVSEGKPFGEKISSMFEFIKSNCERDSLSYRDIDGYALEITLGEETSETFGILSHIDTVPKASGWSTNPLELTKVDNWYYGLGATDDKGATAIVYTLMKFLHDLNLQYKRQIKFVIGGAEERGFYGLQYYFKNNPYMSYGVSPDGNFPGTNFEKSLYDYSFTKKFVTTIRSDINIISIQSGTATNVVPQFCDVVLEIDNKSIIEDFESKLNSYGIDFTVKDSEYHLKFVGKPAHGSMPQDGINSIYKFIHFINEYKIDSNSRKIISDLTAKTLDDFYGEKLKIDAENKNGNTSTTLAILNYKNNDLNFVMNIRHTDAISSTEIESKIKNSFIDYEISSDGKDYHYVKEDSFTYLETAKAYTKITGSTKPAESKGGGTYARMLKTGMSFGPNLEEDTYLHQANERISEKSIETTFKVYLELLNNVSIK